MSTRAFITIAVLVAGLISYVLVVHRALPGSPWTFGRVLDAIGLELMVLFPTAVLFALILGINYFIRVAAPLLKSGQPLPQTGASALPDFGLLVIGVFFPLLLLGSALCWGGKWIHNWQCDSPEDV